MVGRGLCLWGGMAGRVALCLCDRDYVVGWCGRVMMVCWEVHVVGQGWIDRLLRVKWWYLWNCCVKVGGVG